jgi:hypothetical protein
VKGGVAGVTATSGGPAGQVGSGGPNVNVTLPAVPSAVTVTSVNDSLASWLAKSFGVHGVGEIDGAADGGAAGDGLAAGDDDGDAPAEGGGLSAGDGLIDAADVHPVRVRASAARAMKVRRIMRSSVRDAR